MNKAHTFVFFGIVGSGKGTQAELLKEYLINNNLSDDVFTTSTGAEYRKLLERKNYTSKLVESTIEKGELQPNFLTISLFSNILTNSLQEETSFIVDGYPRTIEQSEAFENMMKFYKRDNIHIVHIELSKEEAIKRMKLRNRSDDNDEGITKRLKVYNDDVVPSMNYFKDKVGYTMHIINGEQTIDEVQAEILKSLQL